MTTPELDPTDIGNQLGEDGVNSVVGKVEQFCAHEERRIELRNQPAVLALRAEFSLLREQEGGIEDRLRSAPPPGGLRHRQRKKVYAWSITAVLTAAGFVFALLSFEPFRLGWKSYLYCLGIAVTVPFLVERLLDSRSGERIAKSLAIVAVIAGIASLMLLAVIRGDLLAQQVQSTPAVVIDGNQPAPPDSSNAFYGSALGLLRAATVLLSLAMELGSGLALRDAWNAPSDSTEDWVKLREELWLVQQRMVEIVHEATTLDNEPALFAARFWRDFYGSMLTHTLRSSMTKLLILAIALMVTPRAHAATSPPLNLVIAIDLSKSVAVHGPDGTTEFQKNLDGVTRLLTEVPADSHVTVVGITGHSFTQPYILLSATVPSDAGYFGERLNSARNQLAQAWKRRSATLAPNFASTDIFGALLLASQIYQQSPVGEQRVLVLFSDMRNSTQELDLESPRAGLSLRSRGHASKAPAVDLHHVDVYALGVDGAGHPAAQWQRIERFWSAYFSASGASLKAFSVLRALPQQELK